jgi:ribosomal protein S18 acetylase RimI-like enzyme
MTVAVRPISTDDRAQWQPLYLAYLEFYKSEPIESSVELVWSRLTSTNPEIQGLVVEQDGKVIGFAHFHYQITTWSQIGHCYLEDLFVGEHSRGKGAARALIAEVRARAVERGYSELFWITRSTNTTARTLYDKVATATDFIRYEIPLED